MSGSMVESIKPKYPIYSALFGSLCLALHYAGWLGAWSRGFTAGYLLDLDFGGVARMFGAVVGCNVFAWTALYMGFRMRPIRFGMLLSMAAVAGILLGIVPQYGERTRRLFGGSYYGTGLPAAHGMYWSGRTREKRVADALDRDPVAGNVAETTGYADTGVVERIGGAIMRLRQGVVYNAVRHADGIGQTMSALALPPGTSIMQRTEKFLVSHPDLRPPERFR